MIFPTFSRATLRPLALACTFASIVPGALAGTTAEEALLIAQKKNASEAEKARLLALLNDRDAATRAAATLALRNLGEATPEVLSALEKNLDAPAEQTRSVTATALMFLGPEGERILRQRVDRADLPLQKRLEAIMALRSRLEGLKDPTLSKAMEPMFREIQQLESPPAGVTGESPFQNATFAGGDMENDWLLITAESKGEAAPDPAQQCRDGKQGSLRLSKLAPGGEISLRSKRPLRVKHGTSPTVRLFFRGDDTPANATLQIFFENARTHGISIGEPLRGHAAQSQTLLRNSPQGTWLKRIAEAPKKTTDEEYYIRITLSGNPATVWLSDISAPATPYTYSYPPGMETLPEPERQSDPALTGTPAAPFAPHLEKTEPTRTRLLAGGKPLPPILYFIMRSSFGDYAGMSELGHVPFMVCSVPLNDLDGGIFPPYTKVWTEPGKFDFTTPLAVLDDTARKAPDGLLILNFHVAWPRAWINEHPGEAWLDIEGKKAYGSSIHMRGFTDKLPAGGDARLSDNDAASYRWWPSPYSDAALQSAGEGIERFMAEVKKKPYAHRIAGCFISGGHDGQFFIGWPDYSPPAQKAFTTWLDREYRTDAALQKAWHAPGASLATTTIPDTRLLDKRIKSELFLNPAKDQRFVDQRRFQAEQGMVIRDRLASAFKATLPYPALGLTWQMGGGRGQGSDTLLPDARGLDIIIPQAAYELRQPGYLGGLRASLGSLSRYGKLAVKELDLRTWLRAGGSEIPSNRLGTAFSPEMFTHIFRKEAAEMIATGHGFWLFDIGSSHFRDPEMLKTVADSVRAYKELELQNPTPFQPEIAVAWSTASSYWIADYRDSANIFNRLDRYTITVLKSMGLPFEEVDLPELLKRDGPLPYKFLIFPDAWRLSEEERTAIATRLQKNNVTLLWNYAAGYLTDDGPSDKAISSLTGMTVHAETVTSLPEIRFKEGNNLLTAGLGDTPGLGEASNRIIQLKTAVPKGFQRFIIDDENATPLALYHDGKTAIAAKKQEGWTSVYSGMMGTLDPRLLNRLAREAGAHIFTNVPVGLAFNGCFLSLHGLQNGKIPLHLPKASRVIDFDTGQEIGSGTEIAIPLKAGETRWFRVETAPNP